MILPRAAGTGGAGLMSSKWVRTFLSVTLAALLSMAAGCGQAGSGSSSAGSAAQGSSDSWSKAAGAADEAIKKAAPDALLVISGNSGGVALANVPEAWSYTYYSPSTKHLWRVVVEHGSAQAPEDTGEAKATVTEGASAGSIKVGAEEAIEKARAFGEKSGAVPPNVMVGGAFATVAGNPLGTPGVWTVTFLEGTSLEGSRAFEVDMMSGATSEVTK